MEHKNVKGQLINLRERGKVGHRDSKVGSARQHLFHACAVYKLTTVARMKFNTTVEIRVVARSS
jgi:hypothetical protein